MKTVRVGDLATQVRGVTFAKEDASSDQLPGSVGVVRAGNIVEGELQTDDLVFVPAAKVADKQILRRHDVLIAASSGSLDVVGKAARVREDQAVAFGAFCKVLRPTNKIDPGYFAHYFQTIEYRRHVSSVAAGANINNLKNADLDDIEIPLPPIEEQRRIASILDAADALRTKRRQALAKLDTLAQAIFIDMFGDPLHLRRGGSEPTSESKLGELARVRTGKLDANASSEDGIYPFFTCASEPLRIDVSAFECNAILVAGNGDLNVKYFEGKFNAYQRTYVIDSLDESRAHPRFLHGFLDIYVGRLREQAIGGVIRYIKLGMLTEAVVQLPSQHAQSVYVRTIEAVDAARSLAEHSEKQADALFTALQYRAFRGEL